MNQENNKTVDVEDVNMLNEEDQNIGIGIHLAGKCEM